MGKAIATRLKGQGVEVHAWNRTLARASELDVIACDTPAALASRADVIFLSLFDSASVREVLTMRNGLLSAEAAGKLVVDTTTNHFRDVIAFHSLLTERGGAYLEAPLIGSIIPAMSGSLTILASGEESSYRTALPYFEKLGSAMYFLGEPGLATRIKLVNNLLLGAFMAAIAEALSLSEKAGLDRATALDIFSNGAGNSALLGAKKEKLLNEDFEPHFKCSLMYKDLHYLQDLAATLKTPLFTASVAKELFAAAVSKGAGEEDFSAVYRTIRNF